MRRLEEFRGGEGGKMGWGCMFMKYDVMGYDMVRVVCGGCTYTVIDVGVEMSGWRGKGIRVTTVIIIIINIKCISSLTIESSKN